ncbi:lipoma HMGIC fusion partner-like 2 protein isoform X2 [Zootermopsis nevadensis]|uniref:lipoma HMGIC fusion partner-like 2 protein isoform X2 n=1 Tax=Zootermopsis nevadensis TaxID=136037 RepID=UPI000B8E8405|nr:lipoma HMGIC fusion partner-like 2 protein isoform X2 [Zootermopsis nevadensis]
MYAHILLWFHPVIPGIRQMCYVIVTARSLLWTLLTVVATMAVLSAVLTPKWLIGPPRLKPSVGLYNRCTRSHGRQHCGPFSLHGLATDSEVFPGWWKAALVLLCIGLSIMAATVLTSVLSCCVQSIFRKSIFTMSGAAQTIAGIFYILGLVVYPAGWGAHRVQKLCGHDAAPFFPAECHLGWAFYSAVVGVGLTFVCAVLSVQAEVATSSDKVQYQIHQGRTLICLL